MERKSAAFAKLMETEDMSLIRTAQFMQDWAQLTEEMRERVSIAVHGMALYQSMERIANAKYAV